MAKEKAHIIAMQNGVPVGYVKSVQISKNKYILTQNKAEAKGYTTADACQYDIDKLAAIAFNTNMDVTFIYD